MDLKWREANCAAAKGEKMYHPFTELYLVWTHYFHPLCFTGKTLPLLKLEKTPRMICRCYYKCRREVS